MNRRTTIKSIVGLGLVGTSAFSIFKWFNLNEPIDAHVLLSKKELINELTEMIIPKTDTPGAKDAKVGDFIIKMILNCTEPRSQNKFINGLTELEKYTLDRYKKTFIKCTQKEREAILTFYEEKSVYSINILNKVNKKFFGECFYLKLKDLTVEGYCTSELGATKGLVYDYIPGNYESCIPLIPNQKSWATK